MKIQGEKVTPKGDVRKHLLTKIKNQVSIKKKSSG